MLYLYFLYHIIFKVLYKFWYIFFIYIILIYLYCIYIILIIIFMLYLYHIIILYLIINRCSKNTNLLSQPFSCPLHWHWYWHWLTTWLPLGVSWCLACGVAVFSSLLFQTKPLLLPYFFGVNCHVSLLS